MSKERENKHTIGDLKQMQSLPLSAKVRMTEYRIRQWYEEFGGDVYVSFSGGKDSTVLLHITRRLYPEVEAVFVNTGLEYPSVRKFALSHENVTEIRPTINFREVVSRYGYPVISKEISGKVDEARKKPDGYAAKVFAGSKAGTKWDISKYAYLLDAPFKIHSYCCNAMKKNPCKKFEKETGKTPIVGTFAEESKVRTTQWLIHGCNAFEKKRPISNPMSFWTENDVLTYIHENDLQIAEAYGEIVIENKKEITGQETLFDLFNDYRGCKFCTTGCKRTGCVFCLFGITQDKNRIFNLQKVEPELADYVLRGGEFSKEGMWQPNSRGLGFWFVLDWLNLHGVGAVYKNCEMYRKEYGNGKTEEFIKREGAGK